MKLSTKLLKIAEDLGLDALFECIQDIPSNVPTDFYAEKDPAAIFTQIQERCHTLRHSFFITVGGNFNENLKNYSHLLASLTSACYTVSEAITEDNRKKLQLGFDDFVMLVQALPALSTLTENLNLNSRGEEQYEEGGFLVPGELVDFPIPVLHQELKRIAFCYQTWEKRAEPAARTPIENALRRLGYTTLGGLSGKRMEGTSQRYPRTLEVSKKIIDFPQTPSPYLWSEEVTNKNIRELKAARSYLSQDDSEHPQQQQQLEQILGKELFEKLKTTRPEHVPYLDEYELSIWIVKLANDKRIRNFLNSFQEELAKEGYQLSYKKPPVPFRVYTRTGYFKVPYKMKRKLD